MPSEFKSLRFTGTAVTAATFLFQIMPPILTYLAPIDIEYRLSLTLFLFLPAVIGMILLQAKFFSNAISNLHVFKAGTNLDPRVAWLTAVPFVSLLVLPWLTYSVHERSMSLPAAGTSTPDRSGWLTLAWYGTFVGAFVIGNLAGLRQTPDQQFVQSLFASGIGLVNSWLTKRVVGEISEAQEVRSLCLDKPVDAPAPHLAHSRTEGAPSGADGAPDKTIVSCPSCAAKMRVPTGKSGKITCAKCSASFETST